MSDGVAVRLLTADDLDLLARAGESVFDGPARRDLCAEFLADRRHHLIAAIAGDRIVGFVSAVDHVHPDEPRRFWLNEVATAEPRRRRGIAARMVRTALDRARVLGRREAWVATEPDDAPARALDRATSAAGEDAVVAFTCALDR